MINHLKSIGWLCFSFGLADEPVVGRKGRGWVGRVAANHWSVELWSPDEADPSPARTVLGGVLADNAEGEKDLEAGREEEEEEGRWGSNQVWRATSCSAKLDCQLLIMLIFTKCNWQNFSLESNILPTQLNWRIFVILPIGLKYFISQMCQVSIDIICSADPDDM